MADMHAWGSRINATIDANALFSQERINIVAGAGVALDEAAFFKDVEHALSRAGLDLFGAVGPLGAGFVLFLQEGGGYVTALLSLLLKT